MDKYGKKINLQYCGTCRNSALFDPLFLFFVFLTVYNDGTTKDLMSLTGTIPVIFEGNNDFAHYTVLCELTNQLNHNWKLHLTAVQIRNKKRVGPIISQNVFKNQKKKIYFSFIRRDLQHPSVPVDRGKLPPDCSYLLCHTHT